MKVAGIICEYNPFHNGHKYHIEETRRITGCDTVAAVMSGSFVQRGEPAIYDKWSRAKTALRGGIDLVIELPVYYSLKSANQFAFGATSILNALNCVDFLSFGSECGDTDMLSAAAEILNDEPYIFRHTLKENLQNGVSFAGAYEKALEAVSPAHAELFKQPNNILGIEYISSLLRLGSKIKPFTVKRCDNGYNSLSPKAEFASATNIRKMVFEGNDVSRFLPSLPKRKALSLHSFEEIILYRTLTASNEDIAALSGGQDGVLNRILAANTTSLTALLDSVKTKRIPMSRVKRSLITLMLGARLADGLSPSYIRILGMNEKGAALIKNIKSKATLPIITKPSSYTAKDPIWELENRATDIYFLPISGERGLNLKTSPVIEK